MKMKCTLHAQADKYAEGGFSFSVFHEDDMTSCGYVACDTVEVEFKEPPRDVLTKGAVESRASGGDDSEAAVLGA